uniref:formin-like protein 8 n=1 Tax=Erigeron canadensis TaxID=72917 RepID=UPI001CB965AF|nr:formin-like protein 8 [Erigeron canadensis]
MAYSAVEVASLTSAITVIIFGICFYLYYRYTMAKKSQNNPSLRIGREDAIINTRELAQQGGTFKGVLVEENGLEVLYLRKLEGGQLRTCVWNSMESEDKRVDSGFDDHQTSKPIHECIESVDYSPKKTTPQHPAWQQKPSSVVPTPPPPPPPPPPMQKTVPPIPPPPPPQPSLQKLSPPIPPPPPPSAYSKKIVTPQPPPVFTRRNHAPPPSSFHSGSFSSSMRPPTIPKVKADDQNEERSKESREVPKKMKPFHWDKVNTDADHSVVWNEIVDGSLKFDEELIETLFGYKAIKKNSKEAKHISPKFGSSNSTPSAQASILDPRKSQNTAIVLKSLAISRKEIIDAISDGRGLNGDILEKLTKISPTEEEASRILQFNGNPAKLPDAESFLYEILKEIPTAFTRINAMLFRSNYDPEILHLKESLQTLELGCKELRAPGIFLKLLEAILKAGNRMNAGTARGNAKGFNLSALRKLSYVKSIDGDTTLLHFVVEQVARAEGRRCMINRNHQSSQNDQDSDTMIAKEERDRKYVMLGLPVLGGLSTDFANVKKAATLDYDSFVATSPNLSGKVCEIQELVTHCGVGGRDGFVKEMKEFLEDCEDELKVVREEQTRVMNLVKKTTDFYQIGSFKDKGGHSFQIFGFVKDFLDMVDQVCADLTRKVRTKTVKGVGPSSLRMSPLMAQNMQSLYFKPESSSDSEDDF